MDYTKKLVNLNPEKAAQLDQLTEMTGITRSQIINDALAIHYGSDDKMVLSRRETIRIAMAQIQAEKPTPKPVRYSDRPPFSAASMNDRQRVPRAAGSKNRKK